MKQPKPLQWMLLLVIVVISIPLTIIEEVFKPFFTIAAKVRLNYQLMMFIFHFTR